MISTIKIFGLPRSGTNLSQVLIPLNFKINTCLKTAFNDYLGWKHSKPKPIENYNEISKITNENFLFIFCIRDFKSWEDAYLNKHKGSFELPWAWANQKDKFIFNAPEGPEIYDSIHSFYEDRVKSYKDFYNTNSRVSFIVNYEDLLNNQVDVLKKIRDKFNLKLAQKDFIEINKKINWHGEITGEII